MLRSRSLGLVSQAISSIGNFAVSLAALRLGSLSEVATTGLILASHRLTVMVCRSVVAEPLLRQEVVGPQTFRAVMRETALFAGFVGFVGLSLSFLGGGTRLVWLLVLLVTVTVEVARFALQVENRGRLNLLLDLVWTGFTLLCFLPAFSDISFIWIWTWLVGAGLGLVVFAGRVWSQKGGSNRHEGPPFSSRLANAVAVLNDRAGFQLLGLAGAFIAPTATYASFAASRDVLGVFNPAVQFAAAAVFGDRNVTRRFSWGLKAASILIATCLAVGVLLLAVGELAGEFLFGSNGALVADGLLLVAIAVGMFQATQVVGAAYRGSGRPAPAATAVVAQGAALVGLGILVAVGWLELPLAVVLGSGVALAAAVKRLGLVADKGEVLAR